MHFMTLSDLIRESFEREVGSATVLEGQAEESLLANAAACELPRLVRDAAEQPDEEDALLAALLRAYRRAPVPSWSAVLLEALSPMLVPTCARFPYRPLGVDDEDVQQQVIAEALDAAGSIDLPEQPRRVRWRVEQRVLIRTARWLIRSARGEEQPPAGTPASEEPPDVKRFLLLQGLLVSGASPENLEIVYRAVVLGQTARQIAAETQLTEGAIQNRIQRALERLRECSPAQLHLVPGPDRAAA